jgi:hypothetical protein
MRAPRQTTRETSISKRWNYGREMNNQISLTMTTSMSLYGSFTCRKAATWDRWLYFPSEGRYAEDFFARKIRRLRPGLNTRTWVPEAGKLTTRPLKPLLYTLSCFYYPSALFCPQTGQIIFFIGPVAEVVGFVTTVKIRCWSKWTSFAISVVNFTTNSKLRCSLEKSHRLSH